jgi:hypothetical protein
MEHMSRKATLTILMLVLLSGPAHAAKPADLQYFTGTWQVSIKAGPQTIFTWTLKPDLNAAWLSGTVQSSGSKVSADYWRVKSGKIERLAFTADTMLVKVESPGWSGSKLVFTGTISTPSGSFAIRETISKLDEDHFKALWEDTPTQRKMGNP